jgi:DnaJ-class molecular chaperone
VAYTVLSDPYTKKLYDSRCPTATYDVFASQQVHPDETFRSVIIGVFNDFLDGDLEMIRTFLSQSKH